MNNTNNNNEMKNAFETTIGFRTIFLSPVENRIDFSEFSNYNLNDIYFFCIESTDIQFLTELNSRFPKYCKAKFQTNYSKTKGAISFDFNCFTNEVTGSVNETMIKRRNKVLEIIQSI